MFTEADFNGWRFDRDAVHFNGGKVFFGWGHRCVDQPRLLVIDKYFKADRSTKRSYVVDGKTTFEALPEALVELSAPPVISPEDIELLRKLPDDWSRQSPRSPYLPLAEMGLIEWGRDADDKVTLRRTAAGTQAVMGRNGA